MVRTYYKWKTRVRRNLSRRRLKEFPLHWHGHLQEHVDFYRRLPKSETLRFEGLVWEFIHSRRILGHDGLELTEEHIVVVAAAAARLVLGLHLGYLDHIHTIVLTPKSFRNEEYDVPLHGLIYDTGKIILSWEAVRFGLFNVDGECTASHEFAHALDIADGRFDAALRLNDNINSGSWSRLMQHHFEKLHTADELWHRLLNKYSVVDESEFFATVTEIFFEKPHVLAGSESELYKALVEFYRQDPREYFVDSRRIAD